MKEGLHPSDIDRMVAVARIAIGEAMKARYEATEAAARYNAGNDVRRVHRILNALHTLDVAFPREVSATARSAREEREAREKQENAEQEANQAAPLEPLDLRALLALLESAQIVAECVDAERGHGLPQDMDAGPNGTRRLDLAESVNMLCHRLRGEIFGGAGRD